MRRMTLPEILSAPQLKELDKLLIKLRREKLDPMDPSYAQQLKDLFCPWTADLEAKGFTRMYLAHVVSYMAVKVNQEDDQKRK
jgi:hypothetical protein